MKFEEIPVNTFFQCFDLDTIVQRVQNTTNGARLYHRKTSEETVESYEAKYSDIKLVHTMLLPLNMFNNPQLIKYHSHPMTQDGELLVVGDEIVAAIKGKLVRGKIQEIIIPSEKKMLKMAYNIISPHGLRIVNQKGEKFNLTRGSYGNHSSPILKISSLAP